MQNRNSLKLGQNYAYRNPKLLQLLGDFVPQTPYRGFTPGPNWGTSVPQNLHRTSPTFCTRFTPLCTSQCNWHIFAVSYKVWLHWGCISPYSRYMHHCSWYLKCVDWQTDALHRDASSASSNAAVEDAAKAALLKIVKMAAPVIMEKVVQLPVFVCRPTDNPSIVNRVVENMYVGN